MKLKITNCKKDGIKLDSLCELDLLDGVCKDSLCQWHSDYLILQKEINYLNLFDEIIKNFDKGI